jgi:hypothetical protein
LTNFPLDDRLVANTIRKVARKVAGTFENFTSHYETVEESMGDYVEWRSDGTDDKTTQIKGRSPYPVPVDELVSAGWATVMRYMPKDWQYFKSTLERDLFDEAAKLMRQSGWKRTDGEWEPKDAGADDYNDPSLWLFGTEAEGNAQQYSETFEKLAADYPTLAAAAEHLTQEATAAALGISRATVTRRVAAERAIAAERDDLKVIAASRVQTRRYGPLALPQAYSPLSTPGAASPVDHHHRQSDSVLDGVLR